MATHAADVFVRAWVDRTRLIPETFPAAPATVDDLYKTHLAIQQHELVASCLGGHGGYKLGAIGGAGEACLYAPLFGNFLVEAPGNNLSAAELQLWQVEPEIAVIMGSDLPTRADGEPHSVHDVWSAVETVVLCIECCGKRGTPACYEGSTKLGSYADCLSSGGVVLGPRLSASTLPIDAVRSCKAQLIVNDEVLASGSGAATPEGGPAEALTWLANHLNSRGLCLARGNLVATGQICNTKLCKPGDRVTATFEGLGSVEMVVMP